jgi:precorrin-6B methylase 2
MTGTREMAGEMRREACNPTRILGLATSFWMSKVLLSAVQLDLFTRLGTGPMTAKEIEGALGLHPRASRDFLDALVSLDLLSRDGEGRYGNTPETGALLDSNRETCIGGFVEMCEQRLYPFWGNLTSALRSGRAQNESNGNEDFFSSIYAEPARLRTFLQAMTGITRGTARILARKFPWERYRSFADIGCAQGSLGVEIAAAHPYLSGVGFDLPIVAPVFEDYIASQALAGRLRFHAGDFHKDDLPEADVLVMGHILHDWNLEQKKSLLEKAYAALPRGGSLIVYEALIDDERRTNTYGLLMSLNMLLETPGGFDFTGSDCSAWMKDVGFAATRVEVLDGADSMIVGVK